MQSELRTLRLTPDDVSLFNRLAGSVVFANPAMRQATALQRDRLDRTALWAHGISGDLPIVLVRADGERDHALISQITMGHDFARRRGLRFDLVLLDEGGAASAKRLAEKLQSGPQAEMIGKPGGIFVLSEPDTESRSPGDHRRGGAHSPAGKRRHTCRSAQPAFPRSVISFADFRRFGKRATCSPTS